MTRLAVLWQTLKVATTAVKAKERLLKQELRRLVTKQVHLKQADEAEREIARAIEALLRSQFADAAERLGRMGGEKRRDGTWRGPESTPNYHELVQRIRQGKEQCAKCGSKRKLLVHHRDGDSKNDSNRNLQVLCDPCHRAMPDGPHASVVGQEKFNPNHGPDGRFSSGPGGAGGGIVSIVREEIGFRAFNEHRESLFKEMEQGLETLRQGGFLEGLTKIEIYGSFTSNDKDTPNDIDAMLFVDSLNSQQEAFNEGKGPDLGRFHPHFIARDDEALMEHAGTIRESSEDLYGETDVIWTDKSPRPFSTKSADASDNLALQVFNPRAWDRDLFDTMFPVLLKAAGEAAAAQMLMMGVDVLGWKRKSAGGVKFNPNHGPDGRFSSGGGMLAPDAGGQFGGGGGESSDFDIRVPDYTKESLVIATKDIFGRDIDYSDIAQMAGAPPGSRVDFEVVTAINGENAIRVDVKNEDLGISAVRKFYRDEGEIILFNDGLTIDKDHRGSGLGTELFKRQVDNAVKNGVSEIRTVAGAGRNENGYYTWPRLGYDQEMKESDWPWSKPPESLGNISRISDLMRTKEGREWWKNNGGTLKNMAFDLKGGSQSRRVLDAYVQERASRKSARTDGRGRGAFGSDLGQPRQAKATTATQWFAQHGTSDELQDVVFNTALGPINMRFMTEWPEWMKKSILEQIQECFEQEFWDGINDTTLSGIEYHIRTGLEDGLSINQIAEELRGDGLNEYYHGRAKNIARTEAGNALNGARRAAMDQLAEEVPGLVMQKTWLSVLGTTTRDTHANLDGVPADKDGLWYLGGVRVPWPGHWALPVGERANCQCTIVQSYGMSDTTAEQLIEEYNERTAFRKAVWDKFTADNPELAVKLRRMKFNPNHGSDGRFSSGGSSDAGQMLQDRYGLTPSQAGWAAGMIGRLETIFNGPGRAAAVSEVISAAQYPEYLKGILAESPSAGEIEAVVAWSVRRGRVWEAA